MRRLPLIGTMRTRGWRAAAHAGQWLVDTARARLDLGVTGMVTGIDDPIADVLYRAIGDRTGKLRVSDAYLICGLEAGRVTQDQMERFGRAIRELGWERARRQFGSKLDYTYVKGSAAEREVALVVEYDPHMRSVRIEVANERPPAAN